MLSGFKITDAVFDIVESIFKKKKRYAILKFDPKFTELQVIKEGGKDASYDEVLEYFLCECAKSFCYVFFDFNYKTAAGQVREKVVCLKLGVPEYAPIKEKMIYASSYKALQEATKSLINIDCTDKSSHEYDTIVDILLKKHESTN